MSGTKLRDTTKVLKATEDVHIRSGEPKRDDDTNKKGIIYSGHKVEVVEEWKGQEINQNDLWYRDKNGDFFWSGGFEEAPDIEEVPDIEVIFNYREKFTELYDNDGTDVRVAVLDTGINANHLGFNYEVKNLYNAVTGSNRLDDQSGHGTHVAGIIGARRPIEGQQIVGIVPKADICAAKVATNDGIFLTEYFLNGLDWAINEIEAQIVNLSFRLEDFTDADYSSNQRLKDILTIAEQKNIILVSAAGDGVELFAEHDLLGYPAKFGECITVGGMDRNFYQQNRSTQLHPAIDFIAPREYVSSLKGRDEHKTERRGSSMSAAILTGVLARAIHETGNATRSQLIEKIIPLTKKFGNHEYEKDPFTFYRA